MSSNINLLERKNTHLGALSYTRLHLLRFIAIGLLFFVSTFSVVLFLLISFSPLPQLKRQEEKGLFTLSQFHQNMLKISYINERTDVVSQILSKRNSFDKVLEVLQSKLPKGVSVDTLSMDNNKVALSVSSSSLQSIDAFIESVMTSVQEEKIFSRVTLKNLSVDNKNGIFLATVELMTP